MWIMVVKSAIMATGLKTAAGIKYTSYIYVLMNRKVIKNPEFNLERGQKSTFLCLSAAECFS